MDLISYILSKKYADKLFAGGGAAKGKNCTIQSIEEIEGGNRVTFQWTLDDGTVQTDTLDVMNGAPGEQGPKGDKGDQGETGPAGADGKDGQDGVNGQDGRDGINGQDGAPGADGKDGTDGVGIVSIKKTQTVGLVDIYTITFTNGETSTFNVTNGASGASTAEDVEYDNSNTQLEATNIQDAIDEIASGSSSKPNIKAIYEESPATAVHSVDDYIYYDSHLYKVIAAIAIGDTLVVDTNIKLASEIEEGTEVFIENLPGESGSGGGSSAGLPEGGTTGQVLTKNSDESGDASWQTPADFTQKISSLEEKTNTVEKNIQESQEDISSLKTEVSQEIDNITNRLYTTSNNISSKTTMSLTGEKELVEKEWYGLNCIDASNVWEDNNGNTYYSDAELNFHYKLNKEKDKWEVQEWTGMSFKWSGKNIWHDGEKTYYSGESSSNSHGTFILNSSTNSWEEVEEWKNMSNALVGEYIWEDEENIYYSYENVQLILNKETNLWEDKQWHNSFWGDSSWYFGNNIWKDGEDIYYSSKFVLNKETDTWEEKTWTSFKKIEDHQEAGADLDFSYVWFAGDGTPYCVDTEKNLYCKLNPETSVWEEVQWHGAEVVPSKDGIWTADGDTFYSTGDTNYKINTSTDTIEEYHFENYVPYSSAWKTYDGELYAVPDYSMYKFNKESHEWEPHDVYRANDYCNGFNIWTDGEDIYYSESSQQYIFNKEAQVWKTKVWNNESLYDFSGENYIWNDGENAYYSDGSSHYILNKETKQWENKTWNGLDSFTGDDTLSVGNKVYCFSNSQSYLLNKNTDTWESFSWQGLEDFSREHFWTDNEHLYYSYDNSTHYILNENTNTWEEKTFSGLEELSDSFYADHIWTDGENIYYSYNNDQYVLNKETNTWEVKTWNEKNDFYRSSIWTDGEYYYLTDSGSGSYKLDKATSTWKEFPFYTPAQFDSGIYPNKIWTTNNNTYLYDYGDIFCFRNDTFIRVNIDMSFINSDDDLKYIWSDHEHTYFSYDSTQYIFNEDELTWKPYDWSNEKIEDGSLIWENNQNIYYWFFFKLNEENHTWEEKSFYGFAPFELEFEGRNIWNKDNVIYLLQGYDNYYRLDKNPTIWTKINFDNLYYASSSYYEELYGDGIWTDGQNIYHSQGAINQFVLKDNLWVTKNWNRIQNINRKNIWTDGNNIYYSNGLEQFRLNKNTSTWEKMRWAEDSDYFNIIGSSVIFDGKDVRFNEYLLNKESKTWKTATIPTSSPKTLAGGDNVWSDGNKIYCSEYYLDNSILDWKKENFLTDKAKYGAIWKDPEGDIYSNDQYINVKLNPETDTWEADHKLYSSFLPSCVWTDGEKVYYSDHSAQGKVFNKQKKSWDYKKWNITIHEGDDIWTDGENTYYSHHPDQYVLNKNTGQWEKKTWNGEIKIISGRYIWTDGKDIYYSWTDHTVDSNENYILNKETSTWVKKDWSNLIDGHLVWNTKNNTYYTYLKSYRFDKSTDSWSEVTFDAPYTINGSAVWTCGDKTYCDGLVFDESLMKWSEKNWYCNIMVDPTNIWTDNKDIYCSDFWGKSVRYRKLNKNTKVWELVSKESYPSLSVYGRDIWTDGEKIYCSSGNNTNTEMQLVLNPDTDEWEQKEWNVPQHTLRGVNFWTDGIDIYYSKGDIQYTLIDKKVFSIRLR